MLTGDCFSMIRYRLPFNEQYRAYEQVRDLMPSRLQKNANLYGMDWYVKSVIVIHVGGTRCVTSSTDNNLKRQARITLTVEFIRGYIFLFLLYV
jgi:hypothetical protein